MNSPEYVKALRELGEAQYLHPGFIASGTDSFVFTDPHYSDHVLKYYYRMLPQIVLLNYFQLMENVGELLQEQDHMTLDNWSIQFQTATAPRLIPGLIDWYEDGLPERRIHVARQPFVAGPKFGDLAVLNSNSEGQYQLGLDEYRRLNAFNSVLWYGTNHRRMKSLLRDREEAIQRNYGPHVELNDPNIIVRSPRSNTILIIATDVCANIHKWHTRGGYKHLSN